MIKEFPNPFSVTTSGNSFTYTQLPRDLIQSVALLIHLLQKLQIFPEGLLVLGDGQRQTQETGFLFDKTAMVSGHMSSGH